MLIAAFMYISKFLTQWKLTINLAKTGQRTLIHYISHLTIGMILFAIITNRQFDGKMNMESPVYPVFIFEFACGYFILSYYFNKLWMQKFKSRPFETPMRKYLFDKKSTLNRGLAKDSLKCFEEIPAQTSAFMLHMGFDTKIRPSPSRKPLCGSVNQPI